MKITSYISDMLRNAQGHGLHGHGQTLIMLQMDRWRDERTENTPKAVGVIGSQADCRSAYLNTGIWSAGI
ncbi:hypothetical protein AAFF_G00101980 [Aldrovandia affinis]|uniref:Uncharacterized protein n=1 Tax=Aldrovandia affinis TaxID=143900 RepID=A0AAD7RUN7_9TELE|nr:hypothetical protein AAFF_G00101980 [Aldrovandia affinis]